MTPERLLHDLKQYIDLKKYDEALAVEAILHDQLVKPIESEEHYFNCYQKWAGWWDKVPKQEPSTGHKVGFVFHSDSPMAHTKVVLKTCELRPKGKEAVVFVFAKDTGVLRAAFSPFDVKVYYLSRGEGIAVQIERMRALMKADKVGTLVWVSLPLWCSYAFATRLAEKQVFWSQRFHPLKSPNIDLYICPGKRSETTRNWHGQDWKVVHTPLCIDVSGVAQKRQVEKVFPLTFGTIGREEKIAVPEYIQTVRRILLEAPGAGFVWTGRRPLPEIQEALAGLPNKFMGWVDPISYLSGVDVYLETFPLGGLSSISAWELGVPVVALQNWHSPYGSMDLPSATTVDEYVSLAIELSRSQEKRTSTVEAQWRFVREEQERASEDVVKFWETL